MFNINLDFYKDFLIPTNEDLLGVDLKCFNIKNTGVNYLQYNNLLYSIIYSTYVKHKDIFFQDTDVCIESYTYINLKNIGYKFWLSTSDQYKHLLDYISMLYGAKSVYALYPLMPYIIFDKVSSIVGDNFKILYSRQGIAIIADKPYQFYKGLKDTQISNSVDYLNLRQVPLYTDSYKISYLNGKYYTSIQVALYNQVKALVYNKARFIRNEITKNAVPTHKGLKLFRHELDRILCKKVKPDALQWDLTKNLAKSFLEYEEFNNIIKSCEKYILTGRY